MSYTLNADNTEVVVKDANETVVSKITNALSMPFAGDKVLHTSSEVFYCALVWGGAGAVAGGMFGRKRAVAGDSPIAGFLF